MTMDTAYGTLLRNDLWITRRGQILERDGHRCKQCGCGRDLEVHHRQYHVDSITGRRVMPWEYEDRYLVTLCAKCHELGHSIYKIPTFMK